MKKLLYILSFFLLNLSYAQHTISEHESAQDPRFNYLFSLDLHSFVPLNKLNHQLDDSFGFGLYFGTAVSKQVRVDLGVSLFFPKSKRKIQYFTKDEVLEGGTSMSGNLGLWTTLMKPIGRRFSWENRLGLGIGFFQTDIETGKPKEDNDSVYGVETVFVSLGTGLRTMVLNRNISLKFEYFFVPYNLFKKRLSSDFGTQYATFGLSFAI